MTQILFENPELDKERRQKLKDGYFLLGSAPPDTDAESILERFFFIEDEALAAGLLWENDFSSVSVRSMGVTEKGDKFLTKGDFSSGLKSDFYVNPGMLQAVLSYLDSAPEAVKIRSIREEQKKILKEAEERKTKIDKESSLETQHTKEEPNVSSPVKIGKNQLTQRDPVSYETGQSSRRKDKERPSPSVITIFSGMAALFFVGVAKVFVEDKNGPGSADFFVEPLLILIFSAVPTFVVLRYIFKEGVESAGYRSKGLVIGVAAFLVLIWLVSLLDGGGPNCFYIVGCI